MDLMPHLQQRAPCLTTPLHVALLMPCHATPGYSHLHTDRVVLLGLDCSPRAWAAATAALQADPWGSNGVATAMARAGCGQHDTATACFLAQPLRMAAALFKLPAARALTHVALFEQHALLLAPLLKRQGLVEEQRWWHADVPVDDIAPGHVVLFRRRHVSTAAC